MLGLRIVKNFNSTRNKEVPVPNEKEFTRRELHQYIGEILGHFPGHCQRVNVKVEVEMVK